jgi:phage terminase small subunit
MNRHLSPPKAANRVSERARPLSARQEQFCREYLVDLNATLAAARAGYSKRTVQSQGSQQLMNPNIRARIAELQAARLDRNRVDSDFVLHRLLDEVNADAGDLYGQDGRLLPVKQWPAVWRRGLVSTIRTTTIYGRGAERGIELGEQTDVVLVDRARRLELLGKHIKVNAFAPDRVQLGMDTPLQELFKQIAGNVIRPASEREPPLIEHQGATDAEILAPDAAPAATPRGRSG